MIFGILLAGMAAFVGISWILHLRGLKQHEGTTRAAFIARIDAPGASAVISGAVYDHFRELGVWKGFMPSPSDTLVDTYKLGDEDFDDSLKEILQQLGYEMPHSGILREWFTPIESLEDVVGFVNWIGTKQNATR
jgi:hypothetical protein